MTDFKQIRKWFETNIHYIKNDNESMYQIMGANTFYVIREALIMAEDSLLEKLLDFDKIKNGQSLYHKDMGKCFYIGLDPWAHEAVVIGFGNKDPSNYIVTSKSSLTFKKDSI